MSTSVAPNTEPTTMIRRTYSDAIRALNSLQSNYATIEAVRQAAVSSNKQTLMQRNAMLMPEMIEWTRRIGIQPADLNRLNVIHVTGTKGKGSTCAFVQSILSQYRSKHSNSSSSHSLNDGSSSRSHSVSSLSSASGSLSGGITKIGLYTSPHLKSVRERIMINGKPITEDLFTKYFFEVWDKLDTSSSDLSQFPHMGLGSKPAYFRFLTLLSFHTFLKENVNTAIYEVGVGGEYDSTNVFEKPTCCGISALGIDHVVMLGDTYEEIAWNKSGIFKKDSAAFTVQQVSEGAMQVIHERAKERQVAKLSVVSVRSDLDDIELGLKGDFQKQNASLAVELCAEHLNRLNYYNHIDITNELPAEFIKGLETAQWPGRCQTIVDPKRPNEVTWYIDGAHTKESIENGSKWFTQTVQNSSNKKVLLFNQQTRDVETLITQLHKVVSQGNVSFDHVIFTTNITWSSGYSEDLKSINTSSEQVDSLEVQHKMAEIWNKLDKKTSRKHIFHDIETSVNFIRSLEGNLDVFVCGSLHLVGGFLVVLDGQKS